MRKLILCTLLLTLGLVTAQAQMPTEGVTYFLPKTALRFSFLIEKKTFTPGEYARYSERYIKTAVKSQSETNYSIVKTEMTTYALPDSAKQFTATIDKKHSIVSVDRDQNGVIMAVNARPKQVDSPKAFVPSPKTEPINPSKYMTAEMLAAGSNAKTAELIAQEIYDIRSSKNQLSKGEADFMPKDGEQLRIMLNNLDTQEQGLLTFFQGTSTADTTEIVITYIPNKEVDRDLLFRFSPHLGMVDKDDLGGAPYYIRIKDLKVIPVLELNNTPQKKNKDDVGINVNLPGKIEVTLSKEEQPVSTFETYAAQFGRIENISGELFGKKFTTHIILNPVTGNVESLQTESLE